MSFRSQNRAFLIDYMRENNFHNTTNLKGVELLNEQLNANSLQKKVIAFFEANPTKGFIWSDLIEVLNVDISQYGSIKRCLTNLLTLGKLYKSTNTKKSIFGKKAHYYFFNSK